MEFQGVPIGDAFQALPAHVQTWLNWINLVTLAGVVFLGMREAWILIAAFFLSFPLGIWIYGQVGLNHPLSGISHVVFWLPAVWVVLRRMKRRGWKGYEGWYRKAGFVWAAGVVATFLASNAFDVLNLIRFLVLDDPGPRI